MKFSMLFRGMTTLMMLLFLSSITHAAPMAKFSPAGKWEYSVPGVPEAYSAGVILITENDEGFVVEVGPSVEYLTQAEKVEYSKKKISFIVYVEDQEVKVWGSFGKNQFTGTVSYVEGEFEFTATKIPDPEAGL